MENQLSSAVDVLETEQEILNNGAKTRLVNRNILADKGRSSMRLEPEIWDALFEICKREKITMADLVRSVDSGRQVGGRTSAIRVFAFEYFRKAATEDGHRLVDHGSCKEPATSSAND